LANTLEVVTRRAGEDRETRVLFDWSQFDDEHKYLDQVKVLWEESEPAEICPGSTIQALWREDQTPESSELTYGTILRMEGLRAIWGESQLETLLGGLAHERGATITDIRRDLDAAAGINIYRDGFRVLPYGESRNDWLRLDLRRVQNPTMRLSNNQIMGYVLISADQNPQLRDQSNREGLIEGPALDDLRELVKMALAELEKRRYTIRRQSNTGKQTAPAGGLFTDLDLTDISDLIKKQSCDMVTGREKAELVLLTRCLPLTDQVEYQQWRDGLPEPSGTISRRLQELLRNNRQGNQSERFFFLPGALSAKPGGRFSITVTLRREHMRGLERLASLDSPFAEALLARFTRYFGRLGTPDLDVAVLLQRLQAVTGARTT
jgi:hypothetical protein